MAQLKATTIYGDVTLQTGGKIVNSTDATLELIDTNIKLTGATQVVGTVTADGLTLGANELITLGAQTLKHDGTDFVFDDSVKIGTPTAPTTPNVSTIQGGLIVNEAGGSADTDDFRVETDTITKAIFVDASAGTVELNGLNNKIGDVVNGNYVNIDSNGHLKLNGNATVYRDELSELVTKRIIGASKILINENENALTFGDDVNPASEWVMSTIQLNHDRMLGANIDVHIHWEQTRATYNAGASRAFPNFIIQYRYQKQGALKTTAWTTIHAVSNVFTWSTGTLNQITDFEDITPTAGDGVSDIIDFRITRDYGNSLGEYTDAETGTVDVLVKAFDVHIQIDSLGSNSEYIKE